MATRSNDEVAELCLRQAWRDDIDDRSRWVLELAAKRIVRLNRRCLRLSHRLEVVEARMEAAECRKSLSYWHALTLQISGTVATVWLSLLNGWDAIARQFKRLREPLD